MKIIGLCGGSGSGKGMVARLFSEFGYLHIDTDEVYHRLTSGSSCCLDELASVFGDRIIAKDGSLDRRVLAGIVFAEGGEALREQLNAISHRHVLDEVRRIIDANAGKYTAALVDAPLLFESGFDKECEFVIAVIAPLDVRVSRVIERDNITREAAISRISTQISDEALVARSDFVINNDADVESLRVAVEQIVAEIN